MNSGGIKLLLFFAIIGFTAGTLLFVVLDSFVLSTLATIQIFEIVASPWFISGIIGAIISIAIILTYAHFSGK